MLKKPIIIVNFKTYASSIGEKAIDLARICEKVAQESGKNIAIAVAAPDLEPVASEVSIPVLAQHIDPLEPGTYDVQVIATDLATNVASDTTVDELTVRGRFFYVNDASALNDEWCSQPGDDANDGLSPTTPKATVQAILDAYDLEPGDVVRDRGRDRTLRADGPARHHRGQILGLPLLCGLCVPR